MDTNSTGFRIAIENAKRLNNELSEVMKCAPSEARDEWCALQDRWLRFCEDCDCAETRPAEQAATVEFSLELVAEEFEKAFRRIAKTCRQAAVGSRVSSAK